MSTELALIENNPAKLNKLFGFEGRPKPAIPLLKINSEDEEEGVIAPKGTFVYDDGDRVLYTKNISIRVFSQNYQYRLWDAKDPSKTDASVIAGSFREEFRSMSGRIACGKLSTKAFASMGENASAQQKYFQENVKCKLILFGLVSGKFTDLETKEEVNVEDALFIWTLPQSGFMDTVAVLKGVEKERRAVPQTPITVSLDKKKQGSTTYFTPNYVVTTTVAPMVAERDLGYLAQIKKYIKDTNDHVNAKYTEAVKSRGQDTSFAKVAEVIEAEVPFHNDPLEF